MPAGTRLSKRDVLRAAISKALGGGIPGAAAMIVQVVSLMWMRTAINYQHSKGVSMGEAFRALHAEGGIARFYRGVWAALLQAPLSRFGDTGANAFMLALLEDIPSIPISVKTFCASLAAALFRIVISPIDTLKTMLQVNGARGLVVLRAKVERGGLLALYDGSLGSSFATLMGHYPWFITFNFLNTRVPPAEGAMKLVRSALIGFCCSAVSDCVSNSVRVVKTAKQASETPVTYVGTATRIIEKDGVRGLFLRGLGTKLISNGMQGMLFTVCWRYFEELLKEYSRRKGRRIKAA